jgi:uncharacterized protein
MSLIDQYKTSIQNLCHKHQVNKLYAFGSVLTNRFTNKSDVDLLVDFKSVDLHNYADNYFSLKFALEEMLCRSVDLLEERAIKNPYFKSVIESQRQLVYAS